jgi:DNA-binding TFAR19-related protein (PDSD5 family)
MNRNENQETQRKLHSFDNGENEDEHIAQQSHRKTTVMRSVLTERATEKYFSVQFLKIG